MPPIVFGFLSSEVPDKINTLRKNLTGHGLISPDCDVRLNNSPSINGLFSWWQILA